MIYFNFFYILQELVCVFGVNNNYQVMRRLLSTPGIRYNYLQSFKKPVVESISGHI